jgi:hypothetical protein
MEEPELNEGEVTTEDKDEEVDPDNIGWRMDSRPEVRSRRKSELALDTKALEQHRITWGRGVHNILPEHQPFQGADMALNRVNKISIHPVEAVLTILEGATANMNQIYAGMDGADADAVDIFENMYNNMCTYQSHHYGNNPC